jgi:type II restriction/modification system DNA methylase subunit YeeA
VNAQELTNDEVLLLRDAASTQWSDVRPEIFGTLFEGSMDAGERHASGAHFTSQADIARVVGPVAVQPWRARIEAANSISELTALLEAMSQFRVLDPSCGSGNFLYVA